MGINTIASKPVRLAVASVVGLGTVAGIAVAADAATGTIKTCGASLTVRTGPGTGYGAVSTVTKGTKVTIICQTTGSTVKGTYGTSNIWDKIGTGRFVSDAYVYTGSDGRVAPKCGGSTPAPTERRIKATTTPTAARPPASTRGTSTRASARPSPPGAPVRLKHVGFTNSYKGQHWGNANHWDDAARAAGVPRAASRTSVTSPRATQGSFGHVAYVAKVNSNGTFVVEEYNWTHPEHYGTRTVSRGSAHGQFDTFIRF